MTRAQNKEPDSVSQKLFQELHSGFQRKETKLLLGRSDLKCKCMLPLCFVSLNELTPEKKFLSAL